MRSFVEMRYLWRHELNLYARKLDNFLADGLSHAPLPEALKESDLV